MAKFNGTERGYIREGLYIYLNNKVGEAIGMEEAKQNVTTSSDQWNDIIDALLIKVDENTLKADL
jgi:hypothetical protein|tara:strand:- start:409 stop:603 length:195 start_codon:yes stop_codon:yes gene_type:complete